MKLSVITICLNSEAVIRKTIESVLNQDYKGEVEYIIIDGGSKDKTVEIANEYSDRFGEKGYEYVVLSEKDEGIYDAMNKGINKTTGDIVGMINSGDWYEPIALRTVAETYDENPFDMFYADINLIKVNGKIIVKHSRLDKVVSSRHWNHPTTFITKATYDELGTYQRLGVHDDFEYFLRIKRAGKKIVIKNVILANFMLGGSSNSKGIKKGLERIKDRYWAYWNNGYGPLYIFECIFIEIGKAILS